MRHQPARTTPGPQPEAIALGPGHEIHYLADAILRMPKGTRAKEEQNVYLTLFRQAPQTVPVSVPLSFE